MDVKPYEIVRALDLENGTIQGIGVDGKVWFFRTCECGMDYVTEHEFYPIGILCTLCYTARKQRLENEYLDKNRERMRERDRQRWHRNKERYQTKKVVLIAQ